jgi:hypothetical protein
VAGFVDWRAVWGCVVGCGGPGSERGCACFVDWQFVNWIVDCRVLELD